MCILCVSECVCTRWANARAPQRTLNHAIYAYMSLCLYVWFLWLCLNNVCVCLFSVLLFLHVCLPLLVLIVIVFDSVAVVIVAPWFPVSLHFLHGLLQKKTPRKFRQCAPDFTFDSCMFVRSFQSVPVKSVFRQKLKQNTKNQQQRITNNALPTNIFVYSFVFGWFVCRFCLFFKNILLSSMFFFGWVYVRNKCRRLMWRKPGGKRQLTQLKFQINIVKCNMLFIRFANRDNQPHT